MWRAVRTLTVLNWTWGLPNTLVGLGAGAAAMALGGRAEPFRGSVVVRLRRLRRVGGVCLGPVILVPDTADRAFLLHEWGHFRQHLRLGPLYFPVIGIPSVTHALWHVVLRRRPMATYYQFYTEAWADALGGVYDEHEHLHPDWTGYLRWPVAVWLALAGALGLALL